ncbi:DUF397 domain-containing protein [Streptomyces sp. MA15]|uniref:DUF397 domain-containing protein n=1 Tax=unclassified Streptomyces TaxID=2593676 RepID=UPI0025B0D824|nr:DUF397 domain-containing protein [Streptomyces sp. MA15]MDN3272345.1 DUF397 domain-containing protein [Streptomyces sp. MA15]
MNIQQPNELRWFKSTYSGGDGGECVEIAPGATAIHVRDSKERGGPRLAFTRSAWSGFVAGLGRDRA